MLGHDPDRQVQSFFVGVAERTGAEATTADLQIGLFGAIRLVWRAREVRVASRNARALLAIIALDRRPKPRDLISADLWPELPR